MKRTIACLMVAVMLLVSLMGCAGKQAASDDSQGSPVTSAEERETEATEATEATEVTEATEATKVSSDSFDAFVRPKTLAEGETFRMGALQKVFLRNQSRELITSFRSSAHIVVGTTCLSIMKQRRTTTMRL